MVAPHPRLPARHPRKREREIPRLSRTHTALKRAWERNPNPHVAGACRVLEAVWGAGAGSKLTATTI